jgi:molecular chaperone HscA
MITLKSQPTRTDRPQSVIGIDLGTTHSAAAFVHNGRAHILSDAQGPLFVASTHQNISSVKRLLGKDVDDVIGTFDYPLVSHNGMACFQAHPDQDPISPIDISAHILATLKDRATKALQALDVEAPPVTHCVLTVPAYFDDRARQATKQAATQAGLTVLRLVNEPTAAALAYGLDSDQTTDGIYGVYDWGGGTFDVSILRFRKGIFQVLATGGDTNLGGDRLDEALFPLLKTHLSINEPAQARPVARKLREALSNNPQATYQHENQSITLTRDDFLTATSPLFEQTFTIFDHVCQEAGLSQPLDGIILVGGTSRTPYISEELTKRHNIPLFNDLDPDQVVALGAAHQAHNLSSASQKSLLLDVLPLSLGLEIMGGLVEKMIERQTPLPYQKSQTFTTHQDGQTAMTLTVVQGERELAKDCLTLGTYTVCDIPPVKAGMARVDVSFQVDVDGLLSIEAKHDGFYKHVQVRPHYGLSSDDIDSAIREGRIKGAADMAERLLIEERLKSEKLCDLLVPALQKEGHVLETAEKVAIEQKRQILFNALGDNKDKDTLKTHRINLEKACEPFAEKRVAWAVKKLSD